MSDAVEKSSSIWVKGADAQCIEFAWQGGYGAFSLAQSQLQTLVEYIDHQQEHHKTTSFRDELLQLLDRHHVQYDERYLWD